MKSTDTQRIEADAQAASLVLADPRFYLARENPEAITAMELVDHHTDGEHARLEIRYAFTGQLNAAARAILDPDHLTWIQVTEHDIPAARVVFNIVPDHYQDRLRCRGRYRIDNTDSGSIRTVATEVHVRAPLVASQVERILLDGLRNELDAQAAAIPDYVP